MSRDPSTIEPIGAVAATVLPEPAVTPAASERNAGEGRAARTPTADPGRYRVRIDAGTLRQILEVLDPATGAVLFYIPATYRPSEDQPTGACRPAPAAPTGLRA